MSSLILIEGSFRVIWKLVALQACSAKRILREHCRPNLRTRTKLNDTREAWSLLTYYAYARTSFQSQRYYLHIWNFRPEIHFVSLFGIRVSYLYLALKRYLRILRTLRIAERRPAHQTWCTSNIGYANKDHHDGSALSSSPLLPS